MSQPVPKSYLQQVVATWPLVSIDAHCLKIIRLVRRAPGLFDESTEKLYASLVDWLRPRCRGASLEELRNLAETTWFFDGKHETTLLDLLVHTSRNLLVTSGGRIVVRTDERHAERLEHLRWLTLLLPEDLLGNALYAEGSVDPPTDRLSLVSPPLRKVLQEQPVAETHLHVGAAFSFGTLWTAVIGFLAANPEFLASMPADQACPWNGPKAFTAKLVAAANARMILGAFLASTELQGERWPFDVWLSSYLAQISQEICPSRPHGVQWAAHHALSTVVTGDKEPISTAELSLLFRRLAGPRPKLPCSIDELVSLDPLSSWLGKSGEAWPESRFAARAFRYSSRHEDSAFTCIFWQYQRIRNQMYRFLVQEPGTPGLGWFQRHYERIAPFRAPLRKLRFESAISLDSKDVKLHAIEMRSSLPGASHEAVEDVRALVHAGTQARTNTNRLEFGLVYHWVKQSEHGRGRLRRKHADPKQLVFGCRFGSWGYKALVEALAVERALRHRPELLLVLRGFDVASNELSVPTWATLPALFRACRAAEQAAGVLAERHSGFHADPCRMTYHAGEEYSRLVEGLRRVHELLEFDVLRSGDRIGHGTSLGDHVERWAARTAKTQQAREDRLDDLLWELDRYRCGDWPMDAGRHEYVVHEARVHADRIFGTSTDLHVLLEARKRRHDVAFLDGMGFPFLRRPPAGMGEIEQCTYAYLTDSDVYHRGAEWVDVQTNKSEITMLAQAQKWLRQRIAALGLTIESNPSSNLLIADFATIDEHPSFRLRPLDSRPTDVPLLSINADDPVTFATCIGDEIAYVYAALLRKGVSVAAALEWISQRCADGYRSRFTLESSAARGQRSHPM